MISAAFTAVLSALLCGLYLRFALARKIFDKPNERSSHTRPTPHGGGTALMAAFAIGLVMALRFHGPWDSAYVTLAVAALFLTALGVVDDLRSLSVRLRLSLYGATCLLVTVALTGGTAGTGVLSGLLPLALLAFAMLWFLNLYNFMDGIDGIAAVQTILACCSAALLSFVTTGDAGYALFCLLLAAAHCGFLMWNWPPARLFMGDAGSVSTGFLLAGLALLAAVQGSLNPLCWLVLLAVFITDATYTLLWRMARGQRFTQPHRLHAYQRLSRYWGSHLMVDMLLIAINAIWLFPLAWAVQEQPDWAVFLVILAYLPLLLGMVKIRRLT